MNQFHIISPSLLCVYPICPPPSRAPGVRSKPPWTSTVGSSSGSSSSPPEDPITNQQKILGIEQHGNVKRHGKTMNFTSWKFDVTNATMSTRVYKPLQNWFQELAVLLKTNKSRSSAPVLSSMVIHPSPPSISSSLFSCKSGSGKDGFPEYHNDHHWPRIIKDVGGSWIINDVSVNMDKP